MRGKILGHRYELLEIVGYGGMALVYKAKDTLLNRLVAVKILKSEFNNNEQFIKKFQRESQAAASLSHHNIVNVFDVGVEENLHYIVMEYVQGKTLKAYIQEKGRLSWQEAIFITKQITFALDHAHKNNIIHRDIKPQNILLNEELIPKVADFGIARAITSSTITLVEETMGSVHYISPEQARGGFVDAKSDLYSLGIIMYEMLCGKVPFDNDNTISIAIKHIQEDIVFPDEEIKEIPLGLVDILYKLVRKNPLERYATARELIKDLIRIQNDPNARIELGESASEQLTKKTPIIHENQLKKYNKNNINKDKEAHSKKIKKITIISLVILSIFLGVSAFLIQNFLAVKEVTVPDVEGMLYTDALKMLTDQNLEVETEFKNSNEVDKNHIIKQDPKGKEVVKEGYTVNLIISDGPQQIEMPNIIGEFEVDGISKLVNEGFQVDETIRQYNDDIEKDRIYKQSPEAGSKLEKGFKVTIYVSKGKERIEVPDLVGKKLSDARAQLLAEGFGLGEVKEDTSENYDKDIVISQSLEAGSEVKTNSTIDLIVSKGLISSKSISINISDYVTYEEPKNVLVKITLTNNDNQSNTVYDKMHSSDENVVVTLKGTGTQTYKVFIDGEEYETSSITF